MKKWISYTIDAVLVGVIALLGYVQISMILTKKGNYGVPMAFGHSFLYVSTDSMDDEPSSSIWKGNGIVIAKVAPSSLVASTPILDENGEIIDFKKDGDVVTFYYDKIKAPDTHRIIEKNYSSETATYTFVTMGDNPEAHRLHRTETWDEKALIGKVIHHSEGLGNLLLIASPDAAAQQGKVAWLLPVAVISSLVILAGTWVIDVMRQTHLKAKQEEAEMQAKIVAAGIDLEDEEAVEAFRAKEEFKAEYRAKFEEEKEKAKQEARRIYEEEKKKALIELRKEQAKKGEKQ